MRIAFYIFCLVTFGLSTRSYAQFSNLQKDSVLSKLGYISTAYSFSIDFNPNDYLKESTINPLQNLNEEQVLTKVTNHYKDASLFKYLSIYFYTEKKDTSISEKYSQSALAQYENWINTEPNNDEPFGEIIEMLQSTQSYSILPKVLDEALIRFPENLYLLRRATIIYLDIFKDFEKTQNLIDKTLQLSPFDLTACTNQVMLHQYKFMMELNQGRNPSPDYDISITDKALRANPQEVSYQHLYHFARVMRAYSYSIQNGNDEQTFFRSLDKSKIQELEEAEKFFKSQLDKQKEARPNLLNSLGFVCIYLDKWNESKKYFQTYLNEYNAYKAIESLILINYLEKNWKEMERLLELTITKFNDMNAYASLVSLYDEYDKNEDKKTKIIKRIEKLANPGESLNLLLATWYLKKKNIKKASTYCALLNPASKEADWRYLALHTLKNDKTKAKEYLNKILTDSPNEQDALQLKKILGF